MTDAKVESCQYIADNAIKGGSGTEFGYTESFMALHILDSTDSSN